MNRRILKNTFFFLAFTLLLAFIVEHDVLSLFQITLLWLMCCYGYWKAWNANGRQ